MQAKYKYLAKNTLIFAISSFGTKFLSFLLVPLYTNILSTAEYGTAELITTTGILMIYVCTINISDAVMRFVIERKDERNEILNFGIRVLLVGSLFAIFSLYIVEQLNLFDWKKEYYLFIFLYYFVTALYQMITNYLRAVDKVKDVAVAGIISTLIMISGNIFFLIVIKLGINGYLISLILSPFIASVYCMIRAGLKVGDYFGRICASEIRKEMLSYSFPLIFNSLALWINAFLDKYFVTAICGEDVNGVYSVANKIPTILSTCYMVFSQAWSLSAIKEFDREDKDGFFAGIYELYNAAITMACSIIIFMNIPLAKVLYAKEFYVAWNYSSVLLLAVMFNAMTAFLGNIFSAVKKTKAIAVTTLVSAATNILFNIILIPIYGALGAAIATMISYVVMWGMRLLLLRRYIKLRINLLYHCLLYGLLMFQVISEHTEGHKYGWQLIIFCTVILLNRRYVLKIVRQLFNVLWKKVTGSKNE